MSTKVLYKVILAVLLTCVLIGFWFLYSEIYRMEASEEDKITFEIYKDESLLALSNRLDEEGVIRYPWLFREYLQRKGLDKNVRAGIFTVERPVTLARVVSALAKPATNERTITILPGWSLREVADYFEKEGIASSTAVYDFTGRPAAYSSGEDILSSKVKDLLVLKDKPANVSYEGYLRPDTYRVYTDAPLEDIVIKLLTARNAQFTEKMYTDIKASGHTIHEIMTIAGLIEREVQHDEDKAKVADLFWRRYAKNWALQADSTVHYATGKSGSVFTTAEDRNSLSPWNTYKYPGLPPGPISSPSLESIMAAIYPEKNDAWYFLTTPKGEVKYARTLEEHNANKIHL